MAYLVLQCGQCGNQLGEELFSLAFNDISCSDFSYWNNTCARDCWFYHNKEGQLTARAVLVDTERKVLSSVIQTQRRNSPWAFSSDNIVFGSDGGAGNNFALGYNVKGPQLKDATLEILRKEIENCDRVRGIVSIVGCAGGTGSGVGTYILEHVKEMNPHKNLISVLVTPYFSGEVVTQNNNMLFTISKHNNICDAVLLFQNDIILNLIKHQFQKNNIAFSDMNKVISQTLLSFLQPIQNSSKSVDLYDILFQLCPQSSYKFLTLTNYPLLKESKSKFEPLPTWNTVERDILRSLRSSTNISNENCVRSLANLVISRGEPTSDRTYAKIKAVFSYPDWVPPIQRCHQYHQPRSLLNLEKCLTVVSNSSNITGLVDSCISKAWKLFMNNMYVHHYYKFGFTKEDLMEVFIDSEKILKNYNNI